MRRPAIDLSSELAPIFLTSHASLDLRYGPWNVVREVLVACLGHVDDVLDANAADLGLILANFIPIQVAQIELEKVLRHFAIEQEVAEIAPRFDRDHVSGLDYASRSQVGQSGLSIAFRCVSEVTTDIVAIQTDEVAESMGHEQEPNALLHHLTNVSREAAQLN